MSTTIGLVAPREIAIAAMRAALPPPERRRAIRLAAGVPQSVVAQRVGVSRVAIVWWESSGPRRRNPSDAHLPDYFGALAEMEAAAAADHDQA